MWRDPGSTGDEETQLYLHRLKGEAWPFLFVPVLGKEDNPQAPEGILSAAAGQRLFPDASHRQLDPEGQ